MVSTSPMLRWSSYHARLPRDGCRTLRREPTIRLLWESSFVTISRRVPVRGRAMTRRWGWSFGGWFRPGPSRGSLRCRRPTSMREPVARGKRDFRTSKTTPNNGLVRPQLAGDVREFIGVRSIAFQGDNLFCSLRRTNRARFCRLTERTVANQIENDPIE